MVTHRRPVGDGGSTANQPEVLTEGVDLATYLAAVKDLLGRVSTLATKIQAEKREVGAAILASQPTKLPDQSKVTSENAGGT